MAQEEQEDEHLLLFAPSIGFLPEDPLYVFEVNVSKIFFADEANKTEQLNKMMIFMIQVYGSKSFPLEHVQKLLEMASESFSKYVSNNGYSPSAEASLKSYCTLCTKVFTSFLKILKCIQESKVKGGFRDDDKILAVTPVGAFFVN